jgi:hypothetical protein
LDPNPTIRGGSVYLLKQTGIEISFAKSDLANEIRNLNKAFLEQQQAAAQAGFDVKLQLDSEKARAYSKTGGVSVGWEIPYTFFNESTKPGRVFDSTTFVILRPQPDNILSERIAFGPSEDFLVLPDQPVIGKARVHIRPKEARFNWTSELEELVRKKQLSAEVHVEYSVGDQAKRLPKKEHLVVEAEIPSL